MRINKRYLVMLVLILIMGGAAYVYLNRNKNELLIKSIKLSELQNNSEFYLTGVVEPKNIIDYKLDKNKGIISERKVNVGDEVKKGQVLYVYKNPDGDMKVREAELVVSNSEKIVEQKEIESNLKAQQYKTLILRQQELDKNLADNKSEEERKELIQKKEELKASITQYEIETNAASAEIENAKLEVEKASLELNKIKEIQGNHEIVSDIDGIVMNLDESQLNLTVTDKAPDKPFLSIVDTSVYFLRGKVDEYRKKNLTVNQKVKIIDRNDSSKVWEGKITQIGNLAAGGVVDEEQGGNPNLSQFSFEATIDPTDSPPKIGLHCFAELDNMNKKEELTIPKEYVIKDKKTYYIWTVKNKKVEKQAIEIEESKEDNGRYIVKNNLSESVEVIYPSSKVSEGMEVPKNDSTN
ncbi:hypothetical protein ABXL60_05330 [Enterococcus faecalis]|uniref:efflux RND transporter periplasmic adaptor subunit n=1 Tax=Enterococcus faecalis TaxID=1351 RepID=UPI00338F76EF